VLGLAAWLAASSAVAATTSVYPRIHTVEGGRLTPGGGDTVFRMNYVGSASATVAIHLYDDATGSPLLASGGAAVCDPCTFALGPAARSTNLWVHDAIVAAGGFDVAYKGGFAVVRIIGDGAKVHLAAMAAFGGTTPTEALYTELHGQTVPSGTATWVVPWAFEDIGLAVPPRTTFDARLVFAYVAGLAGTAPGGGAAVDIWFGAQPAGFVPSATGTPVCAPCTVQLDATDRVHEVRIDDLVWQAGGFPQAHLMGYFLLRIRGDASRLGVHAELRQSRPSVPELVFTTIQPQPDPAP
jgi:hypothetical protein